MTVTPKLIFGSFRGVGGLRIQTYALKVENPRARAVLIHGSRCHFAAEFLVSEHSFIKHNNTCKNPDPFDSFSNQLDISTLKHLQDDHNNRWKAIGTLDIENKTINIYEDGTNGWEVDDYYSYDDTFCQVLNNNNISVYGMDLPSYGRSESPNVFIAGKVRGLVDDYDNLARDVITFVEKIRDDNPEDIPIYLIGFSMGGGIVSRTVQLYGNKKLVDGIILMSPMLSILSDCLKIIIDSTWYTHQLGSKLLPTLTVSPATPHPLTDPIDILRDKDMLCSHVGIPYKTVYQMLSLIECVHNDTTLIHPDTSVLIFHSIIDDVCFYQGSEQFYNSLNHLKKRRLVTLDNIGHMILYPPLCIQHGNYISEWIHTGDSNVKLDHESSTKNN